mmetsp:Transcript_55003/g.116901  ORF Transcript_55003/g.116901 Transcript_55003/m.116901 type:complete len:269 (-) Transcript_55003:1428-2234(-)
MSLSLATLAIGSLLTGFLWVLVLVGVFFVLALELLHLDDFADAASSEPSSQALDILADFDAKMGVSSVGRGVGFGVGAGVSGGVAGSVAEVVVVSGVGSGSVTATGLGVSGLGASVGALVSGLGSSVGAFVSTLGALVGGSGGQHNAWAIWTVPHMTSSGPSAFAKSAAVWQVAPSSVGRTRSGLSIPSGQKEHEGASVGGGVTGASVGASVSAFVGTGVGSTATDGEGAGEADDAGQKSFDGGASSPKVVHPMPIPSLSGSTSHPFV